METENSQKLFSVSIIHNSKIKELSDGNRVIETELLTSQTTFLLWVPQFLSYELWKLRYKLWKLLNQTPLHYLPIFLMIFLLSLVFLSFDQILKKKRRRLSFDHSSLFLIIGGATMISPFGLEPYFDIHLSSLPIAMDSNLRGYLCIVASLLFIQFDYSWSFWRHLHSLRFQTQGMIKPLHLCGALLKTYGYCNGLKGKLM